MVAGSKTTSKSTYLASLSGILVAEGAGVGGQDDADGFLRVRSHAIRQLGQGDQGGAVEIVAGDGEIDPENLDDIGRCNLPGLSPSLVTALQVDS